MGTFVNGEAKTYGDVLLTLIDVGGEDAGGGATKIRVRVDNPNLRRLVLHAELFAMGPRGAPGAHFGSVQIGLPDRLPVIEATTLVEFRRPGAKIELAAGEHRGRRESVPGRPLSGRGSVATSFSATPSG